MSAQTWTVAALVDRANAVIADAFPGEVWVEGEIRDKGAPSAAGHLYFSLVEQSDDGRPATLRVALFSRARDQVNRHLRRAGRGVRIDDGVRVRIRGEVAIYPGSSSLQLVMKGIDPAFTLGTLAAERAALLERLARGGRLGANATLAAPALPLRIALITSMGSAAEADFTTELHRSGFAFDVQVIDARVQGVDAATELASAVRLAADLAVDVIVLVRGGGARTDLAAFDAEALAIAIAESPHPVHTGVGHETDRSIADEVAHLAHKTPTAVANHLVGTVAQRRRDLDAYTERVVMAATTAVARAERSVVEHRRRVGAGARRGIVDGETQVDLASRRVGLAARRSLQAGQLHLDRSGEAVGRQAGRAVRRAAAEVDERSGRLAAAPAVLDRASNTLVERARLVALLDPQRRFAQGWAVVRRRDHPEMGAIRSADDAPPDSEVTVELADGRLAATVTDTSKHDMESATGPNRPSKSEQI